MELAPRLNVITGDNGLGKSFLLDVIWWALTRKWPQEVSTSAEYEARYVARDQAWVGRPEGRCCRAW